MLLHQGKTHKKYGFGSKVSLTITKNGGLIVGAKNFTVNIYDAHTLDPMLDQTERLTGRRPAVCIRANANLLKRTDA